MVRKPRKFKANHRYKALAFLNRGMKVDAVVRELQRRYHPDVSLADVRKAYFPSRSAFALGSLEGALRQEILERMRSMSAYRSRIKRLNEDPEFARKRDERSRKTMKRLHEDPEFARKRDERSRKTMKRLHEDPDFQRKQREGVARYWNKYWQRMSRLADDMGIHGLGWDYQKSVAITRKTPETELILKERTTTINDTLNSLPVREREVVELVFFSSNKRSLTVEEASVLLRKSEKTVSGLLRKALTKLAKNRKLRELK